MIDDVDKAVRARSNALRLQALSVRDHRLLARLDHLDSRSDTARSLRWARRTLELLRRGVLPDARPVRWDDHLTTHWLFADDVLRAALETSSLAPLEDLTSTAQDKAAETLLAFLTTSGSAPEIAGILGVHPQTARNRLRTLNTLFGDQLHDPDARFGLEISLRARKLRLAG